MANTTPPMEVIDLILLRLPIKDILRSKCVAKSWNNRISSSHFAKLHLKWTLQHSSDTASGSESRSVSERIMALNLSEEYSLQIVDFDSMTLVGKLDYPPGLPPDIYFVGSRHGLICVSGQRCRFALLNPVTRTSWLLTQADLPPYTRISISLGFGYDKGSDDYKIIMVLLERPRSLPFRRGIRVYSLKNNLWRVVSEEPTDEEINSHGAVANGKIHWLAIKTGRNGKCRILSIDFEQEQLGEVPMPYVSSGYHPKDVGSVGENLCLLAYRLRNDIRDYFDVWMMEYGNERSWTRLHSFRCMFLLYSLACSRTRILYYEHGHGRLTLSWINRNDYTKDFVGENPMTNRWVCKYFLFASLDFISAISFDFDASAMDQ